MKRKWLFAISIAAMIGMALWLRELASQPPVVVAKGFEPWRLRFSGDGRLLLAEDYFQEKGLLFNVQKSMVDANFNPRYIRDFDENYGPKTWPHVGEIDGRSYFSAARGQKIALQDSGNRLRLYSQGTSWKNIRAGWSKSRGEVYRALRGEIWIWNWNGKLKRRVGYVDASIYRDSVFSPDGKRLLAYEMLPMGQAFLQLYDVQTGKMTARIGESVGFRGFGFSPDGQRIWFVSDRMSGSKEPFGLQVVRTHDAKILWHSACFGPVKWLPDGRIGLVEGDGFSWRDAAGRQTQHLPGPVLTPGIVPEDLTDWVLSPDGRWIYSCERSGVVRRWRAR